MITCKFIIDINPIIIFQHSVGCTANSCARVGNSQHNILQTIKLGFEMEVLKKIVVSEVEINCEEDSL